MEPLDRAVERFLEHPYAVLGCAMFIAAAFCLGSWPSAAIGSGLLIPELPAAAAAAKYPFPGAFMASLGVVCFTVAAFEAAFPKEVVT
jgi:hypothetical protein